MNEFNSKKKVVFLDRDGIINKEKENYVKTPDEFELLPEVEKWLKILSQNNFKLIIITNQSMIERGLSTKENLDLIHEKMQKFFLKNGFQIDKIYYCPHTPSDNCTCRKPRTDLFSQALKDFSIDINNSWIIGNSKSDIIAGKSIGCKTIKIETNSNLKYAVSEILKK